MKRFQNLLRAALATVIIFTVGLSNVWAQDFKSDLPKCKGKYSSSWSNCYGKQKFINGSYEGEFKDALYNGKGVFKLESGEQYVGGFKDMLKHGWGTYSLANGDKYVGEFKDNKFHGQGTYTWASGDRYVGEHKDGVMNGQGTYFYLADNQNKGDKYEGELKDHNIHGQGTYTWVNGDRFVGEYKDGKSHGLGMKTLKDGSWYYGEWRDDEIHGSGIAFYSDSGKRQEGIWANNKFIREVKVNLPAMNNNVANNTDRTDINDATLAFYDYALRLGIKVEINPNNLTACPRQDKTKTKFDFQRHAKWHNCWGKYEVELDKQNKGDIFEGEWLHGFLDGIGSYTSGDEKKKYIGQFLKGKFHGSGTLVNRYKTIENGNFVFLSRYAGNFRDGAKSGYGVQALLNGNKYEGEFSNDSFNGQGIMTLKDGRRTEGIWENDKFIREAKVNLPNLNNNIATNVDRTDIDRERQQLAEERRRLEEEKRQREQARSSQRINLQVTHSQPNADGSFFIEIKTNADTASLQIDGKEEGGKADGSYVIKRMARAGQESSFRIVATDVYGNTDTKTINVSRAIVESKTTYAELNPGQVKQQTTRDAVAIIIGIADYKSLPKADFASDDARAFYDYAIRALGIKTENIKLLVDSDAEEVEILRTFRNWLPSKVRSTTDVYVFYSGHGLPTADGQDLYLIPPRAAKDLIDDTAIPFSKINAAIQAAKPKSVTMILDACYSGQARSGETLVASARPVRIKTERKLFPENFTVITASQNDQISSSNPDLQHGIFSYYLMKGMEGDADSNKDGKITLGEMQTYLVENVGRQAGMMNRKQEPQLVGDVNRVLVGR